MGIKISKRVNNMKNPLNNLLTQLTPRSLFQILECYTQAWAKSLSTPLIGLGLHNGQEVMGELIHIDFPTERLIIRQVGEATSLHTTFLDFRHIQHFTLYALEQNEGFVALFSL